MKRIMSILLVCMYVFLPAIVKADNWPSILRVSPSIVCDTEDQAIEILEIYQSAGINAAAKVLKRLIDEKNEHNESKCVITPGIYLVLEERQRYQIQDKDEDTTAVILAVFDPRIREKLFIILIVESKPTL